MSSKKLSIIIPVYNDVRVERAIKSVLQYKNEDLELIVADGASTDGTIEVVQGFLDKINRFISEKDNSINEAINRGIRLASGEWIFVLSADDILVCDPMKILKKYSEPSTEVICGNIISKNKMGYTFSYSNQDLKRLDYECSLRHPASFFEKSVYSACGLYDESLRCAGDRDMFLRLRNNGIKFKIIPEFIVIFENGGLSTLNPRKYAYKEDRIISVRYGMSKIAAEANYVRSCLMLMKWQITGKIADLLKLKRRTHYMTYEEIIEIIKGQNQAL